MVDRLLRAAGNPHDPDVLAADVAQEPACLSHDDMVRWLAAKDLSAPAMTPDAVKRRYTLFANLDFGDLPPEQFTTHCKQLLPFEAQLAASQDDIGLVSGHPFGITLSDKLRPRADRPARYAPEQRKWAN